MSMLKKPCVSQKLGVSESTPLRQKTLLLRLQVLPISSESSIWLVGRTITFRGCMARRQS
jgi:hypothetical protein